MNVLTRDFTKREKILLVVLGVIIIAAAYYLLVYSQVETGIASAKASSQSIEDNLVITQAKIDQISAMQAEMDALSADEGTLKSYMPSYNAGKQELDFLHTTLSETIDYYVNFTDLTLEGDQIRRDFGLQFTATDYEQAENIIKTLEESEIRCLVANVYITPKENGTDLLDGNVVVSLSGTFYETLKEGTPDKELPVQETEQTAEEAEDLGY